jgi:hypothetical protein
MRGTFAVLWTHNGQVHTGSVELRNDLLEFRGRTTALTVPLTAVTHFEIERSAADRINGLVALKLDLDGGVVVRVASLQGMGVLLQLAGRLSPTGVGESGT